MRAPNQSGNERPKSMHGVGYELVINFGVWRLVVEWAFSAFGRKQALTDSGAALQYGWSIRIRISPGYHGI